MEYNFNQYPSFGTTQSSLNLPFNPNLAKKFPSDLSNQDTGSSPHLSSNISISSMNCGSRNIHVNKALYYHNYDVDVNPGIVERNKTERVYYNPKFFKNNTNVLPSQVSVSQIKINKHILKKQEPNIYVNPHFIKNGDSNTVATQKKSNLLINPLYRSGIHFNPKFFKDQAVSKKCEISIPLDNQTPQECHNSDVSDKNCSPSRYISKYKIIRKKINSSNISKCIPKKSNTSLLRKYKSNWEKLHPGAYSYLNKYAFKKYLNDKAPLNSNKKIKPYILTSPKPIVKLKEIHGSEARMIVLNRKKSILQQKIEARRKGKSFAMYGFRNYIPNSKYKYRRNPEAIKFSGVSPKSHYSKHHYHKANSQTIDENVDKSVFKTISKMKLVRKSILQTQIESRRYAKKSLPLQRVSQKGESHVSKYKIVHSLVSKRNLSSQQKVVTGLKKNPMTFSSKNYRSDKLKRLHNLTKKLRKNNQPCSFYNRYGRCKGIEKGSCPKVHDPKYVSICKKFLKGECKEEGCILSHDIRPEKMPTCYHYLAGLCKRTNCPYLHIKVNRKAPICRAFLLGFCADVYTCNKRHEFICPVYVEKGYCLKGKSCSLPHRTPSIYSKLLEPDQFPLLNDKKPKKNRRPEVSKTDKHLEFKETIIENDRTSSSKEVDPEKTDVKHSSKHFQRYFLASLTANESVENDNETKSTTSHQNKDDIV
ncbi:uncharacterized protein ZC3H3 [Halyomorpha halys]|uniref:uncharacterized protein ZC3H3 n=1 Tax=Halyomorpha halys TaxID=286706 RepID=UPI0006D4FEB5|nr:uncharacterized protein LOC106692896 [Halyomorpha halys]XP_014294629.1 uncharacterized protein LOC106692896 [Halyomorpha halys]